MTSTWYGYDDQGHDSKFIEFLLPAGKATPAPPVGPELGAWGGDVLGFCRAFNRATLGMVGSMVYVVVWIRHGEPHTVRFKFSQPVEVKYSDVHVIEDGLFVSESGGV